jgi:hypothetical protein
LGEQVSQDIAYIPGALQAFTGPLTRYLPLIPGGVVSAWLKANVKPGGLVLDPFGASPDLVIEAARAGFRVVVVSNNPIDRCLLDLYANPPGEDDLHAAIASIGSSLKGNQRLEPLIRSLYTTICAQCGQDVMADAFIWDKGAEAPSRRIYHCPFCYDSGEFSVTQQDETRATQFSSSSLHRARALERVAPPDDPDRPFVEDGLDVYLSRTFYALFTLINKLESQPARYHRALSALLLTTFDQASTLWPHPSSRIRPRQLNTPTHFREHNVWSLMEEAAIQWSHLHAEASRILPMSNWPDQPAIGGGISLFAGRMKEFSALEHLFLFNAVIAGIPRYNQAYWTLSALWSGWLWGHEYAASIKSVLRRRRYDWAWHTNALHASLHNLANMVDIGTPVLGLIGEAEPGYISAALLANRLAGLELESIALRADQSQAQIHLRSGTRNLPLPERVETGEIPDDASVDIHNQIRDLSQKAAQDYLRRRGEPTNFLTLYTVSLAALVQSPLLSTDYQISPAGIFNQVQNAIQQTFLYHGGFIRYGGSPNSPDAGHWWIKEDALTPLEGIEAGKSSHTTQQIPLQPISQSLSDLVEMEVVRYLQKHPGCELNQIDQALCIAFPGMMTPDKELIETCLESYGCPSSPESGFWSLCTGENPKIRRTDLSTVTSLLENIGQRMGFQTDQPSADIRLVTWSDPGGTPKYAFFLAGSAVLSNMISSRLYPPNQCFFVLPGSRARLIIYKLKTNPRLKQYIDQGWRFVKFRHVRLLLESETLTSETLTKEHLDQLFALDPVTQQDPQKSMLKIQPSQI